jgi:hypothetical protein
MPASPNTPAQTAASTDDVVVTVTTRRHEEPGGKIIRERHSITCGDFDTAVLDALRERLQPWALDQVLGQVRAHRPSPGDPIEYPGSFTPLYDVLIAVRPAVVTGVLPRPKVYRLRRLFLDYATAAEQLPVAA